MFSYRIWTGPISTSVFVPEIEMEAAELYIAYLRKCDKKLREQVTFHFMFPFDKSPSRPTSHPLSTTHLEDKNIETERHKNVQDHSFRAKLIDVLRSQKDI